MSGTLLTALVAHLNAHRGAAFLVRGRVNPMYLPQDEPLPALVVQLIGATREHLGGADSELIEAHIQVDAYGRTVAEAEELGLQVRRALSRWGGTADGVEVQQCFLENQLGTFEEGEQHRVVQDFMVWYEETLQR
jgi:hypothetical protein